VAKAQEAPVVANKNNNASGERTKARIFWAEFDGLSSDFQQLVQVIGQAAKAPPIILNPAALPAPNGPVGALAAPGKQNGEQPTLFDNVSTEAPAQVGLEVPAAQPKPQNGTKRKPKTMEIIPELDCNSGDKPLADFLKGYEPKDHQARYLAIVKWLKDHKGILEVSDRHIYTCYMFLKIGVPDDVGSALRALKGRNLLERGSGAGLYKIGHIGESHLLDMSPKE
jgi:hypothetical protein